MIACLRLLTALCLAALLAACASSPSSSLGELPRIERLLVWLRLARSILEVPEVDRLYGELCKLSELAQQAIDPEALAARQAQAHTVASLKAWRALVK